MNRTSYIPQYIDEPPRILIWSADDFMVYISPLLLGPLLNLGIFTLVLAYFVVVGWRKVKEKGGRTMLKAMIYWYYPKFMMNLKSTPDSSTKVYI